MCSSSIAEIEALIKTIELYSYERNKNKNINKKVDMGGWVSFTSHQHCNDSAGGERPQVPFLVKYEL